MSHVDRFVQIPKMAKVRSPPKSTYEVPREQREFEKFHETNQRQAMNRLVQARSLSFHHLQTEKTEKTRQRQLQLLEEREKLVQIDRFRANPPPKSQVRSLFARRLFIFLLSSRTKFRSK